MSCAGFMGFKQAQALELSVQSDKVTQLYDHGSNKILTSKLKKASPVTPIHPLLDLTAPDGFLQSTDPTTDIQPTPLQNLGTDLFVKPSVRRPGFLQLKGGWLMSQEPEPEKRKSVDGAGISINLRP